MQNEPNPKDRFGFRIQLYAWQFIWDKHKGIAASLTDLLEY